jgi:hypothetical protein
MFGKLVIEQSMGPNTNRVAPEKSFYKGACSTEISRFSFLAKNVHSFVRITDGGAIRAPFIMAHVLDLVYYTI